MADTFPVSTDSPALAAHAPAPLDRVDADLQSLAARREMAGLLAEQRHQFLDLDADSTCPFEGASRYPYLTLGGQP
ncbi:hypothetical protein [Streptomyces yangpuensis]|uniref:hypothetical protein n=1 Tax=Streptomyces yangpuensis TaxID=1648182 RepID=UPI0035D6427A